MAIELKQFINVAKHSNVVIHQDKQGDIGLKKGFFQGRTLSPFSASQSARKNKNLQTMGLFLNALNKNYGNDIASFLSLNVELNSGVKPLNGRVIRQVVIEADRVKKTMVANNTKVANKFIASLQNEKQFVESHKGWLDPHNAAGKQFEAMFNAAVNNCNHFLKEAELKQIAQTIIEKVEHLDESIKQNFSQISSAFLTQKHDEVLGALDKCAGNIMLLAQFDLAGVDKQKLGADDKSSYQERIASTLIQSLSPQQASLLLNQMLNHPTSKEITQLLNPLVFKADIMGTLGSSC